VVRDSISTATTLACQSNPLFGWPHILNFYNVLHHRAAYHPAVHFSRLEGCSASDKMDAAVCVGGDLDGCYDEVVVPEFEDGA
jgi:hypothetical protein